MIDAPATAIWGLLTDADSSADWNPSVVSIEGPIERGRRIKLVSTVDPERTFNLKVAELQAPNRMVWSHGMPLGLFTGRRTYSLDERDDGLTEFTMIEEFSGPLTGLVTKAIPDLTDSFETFADGLEAAAEAGD